MGFDTNKPSATTDRIRHSTWQEWPVPAEFDYPVSGISTHAWPLPESTTAMRSGAPMFFALTSLGLGVLVGSGGSTEYLLDQYPTERPATSSTTWEDLFVTLRDQSLSTDKSKEKAAPVYSAADLVAEIKAALGINITQLAAIAKVSRQTIYDWLDDGQINQVNYQRLFDIKQICADWQSLASTPVSRLLHAKNADHISLIDLLEQEVLDRTAIRTQLDTLALKLTQQGVQRQERLGKLAPLSDKDQRENLLKHVSPATDT